MTRRERDLHRLARQLGFTVERRARHYWLHHSSGAAVTASASPGDSGWRRVLQGALQRALRNAKPEGARK